MNQKLWAAHCDTDVEFFDTEDEALSWAFAQLEIFRRERSDGWDEEGVEAICVMRVTARPEKIDPEAYYVNVDYALRQINSAGLTHREVDEVLERWDETDLLLKRQITAALVARIHELESCLSRARGAPAQ